MRVNLLFVALMTGLVGLSGCIGFNPRNRPWQGGGDGTADAAANDPGAPVTADSIVGHRPLEPDWRTIGYSHKGRPLRLARLGHGPRVVLWVGGIHGDEREGRISTAELPRAFAEIPGAADEVTLLILEDLNPDGTARNTRRNARGVDLNRNYPSDNFKPNRFFGFKPLDQPEARVMHDLVLRERPDLVIVSHSWRGDHFINYDGPARHLAERFSQLSGYRVKASNTFSPTPGSLGSWVGLTLRIPILTLEYERGREPWTAWNETRDAILSVIRTG